METVQIYPILEKPTKKISEFIEELAKEQDISEAIERNLSKFINLVISELDSRGLLDKVLVHNVSPDKIVRIINDELEKEILLAILYFDYWKIKCVFEEGFNKYLEKSLKNFNAIQNQFKLAIWLLLIRKSKEYVQQIRELIEKIKEAMIEFIPEEEFEIKSLKSSEDSNEIVEWSKVKTLR